ncbi:hypothetical protein HID58_056929 [Brassica napus]|uniref:F-box domain-containing protein n=1 Tax=Brassica napus TaxID=3708 RepID=A0ABQ8APQ3_BRANA|nr:hypothetical protein HID58_056929 [Brassica napus]
MENPITVDLLIEIFSRVPLKSIAMFICVSTFLASILRSHDFTELFFNTSLTRPLFTIKDKHKLFFYSSPQPHNQNVNSSLVATPYHCTSLPNYRPTYISKPVCGLVLLQGLGIKQCPLICNPAKGKYLEKKSTPKGIYLGYDPIAKQFKVLCLSLNSSRTNITRWILTLESRKSRWGTLEPNFKIYG